MKQIYQTMLFFLRGLLMGIADAIPGVSGGTIAFITGIYPRLIHSLNTLSKSIKSILKGNFKSGFKQVDWQLFIPLGLGIVISIFIFTGIIDYLMSDYSSSLFALFFGLILASSIVMVKHLKTIRYEFIIFGLLGFVFAWIIGVSSTFISTHSLPFIFFSGMLAISAMLLPGISGAFILVLLGQYQYIVTALHDFNIKIIITFILGAIAGLLIFSKIIDFLFKKWKRILISFLIGLMLGSLRVPWQEMTAGKISHSFFFGLIGFVIVIILDYFFKEL
jgi:putative membrane protein